jgi:hypothetical protein
VTVVTTGVGGGAAVTTILAVPVTPELVAVIVAEPAATPVTTALELTVAVFASLVDHATLWPAIALPWASLTVAWRVADPPTPIDADAGATVTAVATGGGGGGVAAVDATATLDSPPKVASRLRVPRNAISWKL